MSEKDKDLTLLDDIIKLIQTKHPMIRNVVLSFKTPETQMTFISAPCALCAIEDARDNAIENGATHKGSDELKNFVKSFVDALMGKAEEDIEEESNVKPVDELLEMLKNLEPKTKH
jgi:hypothetical protein